MPYVSFLWAGEVAKQAVAFQTGEVAKQAVAFQTVSQPPHLQSFRRPLSPLRLASPLSRSCFKTLHFQSLRCLGSPRLLPPNQGRRRRLEFLLPSVLPSPCPSASPHLLRLFAAAIRPAGARYGAADGGPGSGHLPRAGRCGRHAAAHPNPGQLSLMALHRSEWRTAAGPAFSDAY